MEGVGVVLVEYRPSVPLGRHHFTEADQIAYKVVEVRDSAFISGQVMCQVRVQVTPDLPRARRGGGVL